MCTPTAFPNNLAPADARPREEREVSLIPDLSSSVNFGRALLCIRSSDIGSEIKELAIVANIFTSLFFEKNGPKTYPPSKQSNFPHEGLSINFTAIIAVFIHASALFVLGRWPEECLSYVTCDVVYGPSENPQGPPEVRWL